VQRLPAATPLIALAWALAPAVLEKDEDSPAVEGVEGIVHGFGANGGGGGGEGFGCG